MTIHATEPHTICHFVGGPLHGDSITLYGESALFGYRLEKDFRGEPQREAIYARKALSREPGGSVRDFLVLERLIDQDGKEVESALSDDQALALTLASIAHFWAPRPAARDDDQAPA
jgi:hypothetical protein